LILRGGREPNYDSISVKNAIDELSKSKVNHRVMIDCSHGNSNQNYSNQSNVAHDVGKQISQGNLNIIGAMLESNIVEGKQMISNNMIFGQSITDGCIGWPETFDVLQMFHNSVTRRRKGINTRA
jgi:3-deoxy-7-phosphoheptulonate synthase